MPLTMVDDHTPPVVTGVYMNNPGGTAKVGDTLYFMVSVEDESGISAAWIYFTFVCEQGHEHTVSTYGHRDSYNADTKQVKYELMITNDMLNGTYKLSRINIYDTYENEAYYYPENSSNIDFGAVCFTIEGSSAIEDHNPPVITAVSIEESEKIVAVGDTLHFAVSVEDESGISASWIYFIQHEKRTIEGYPATCGWPGWTDRVVCSACWYVFTEGQNIPATGEHTWGEWQVVQAATSTASGSKERYCETCGTRETEVIPATGSTSSGSGGAGSSGGGSSSSDDSSSPDRSGNVTSDGQNIQATVKSGSAEITNSDKNISSILDGAENGTVHIDVSSYKDVTEVSIPKGVVDAISNSETVSSVSITTGAGTVELHEEALKTLADAMTGSNDIVSFEIKTIDVNTIPSTQKYPIAGVLNSAVFVNLSASIQHKDATGRTTSTEVIHEFGGSVTVSVPYELPANMEGRQIIACHIADDGTITYFPVTHENGVVTFTTTHFSIFAVMESRAAAFGDIDISAWYMLGVEYILDSGLMSGYGNGLFAPNDNLSRAMLTQILYNKEGNPSMSSGGTFADISDNDWYSNAVIWAAEKGIVGGYGDGLFGPNDNITREQFAAILWRYAGSPAAADQELHFIDADMASGYALEALRWATENGILNGYGDGRPNPGGLATRAQAAQILKQYLSKQF